MNKWIVIVWILDCPFASVVDAREAILKWVGYTQQGVKCRLASVRDREVVQWCQRRFAWA